MEPKQVAQRAALDEIRPGNNDRDSETVGGREGDGVMTDTERERIAKLEVRADFSDQRLGRIEDKLDRALDKLSMLDGSIAALPTRKDLDIWKVQWVAIGVAVVVLVITLAFGGIALLRPVG